MQHVPGIHFGLPDEDYHSVPALSSSGIKWLRCSPLDYWARTAWLNPDYEPETSPAMDAGKAYHARIVEGKDAFYERYAATLNPDDYPDALRTMDELRDALRERELKVGGSKADLIDRLLEAEPAAQIWEILVQEHATEHQGKTLLTADLIRNIELAAARIELHPELKKAFSGGMPEVSIMWTDEETGTPMKARLDYLKPKAVVDLKTFANQYGRPMDKAIATAFANGRMHIQAAVYLEAVEHAVEHIKAGLVFGKVEPDHLKAVADAPERTFLFVFQQTGVAPVARGMVLPRGLVYDCGRIAMGEAQFLYAECLKTYGTDPWEDTTPIGVFDDSEIPSYAIME